jgi:methylornithine synthase
MQSVSQQIKAVLSAAQAGEKISSAQIELLLKLKDPRQAAGLFRTARQLREKYFGNKIFLYGFLYVSTYCRNDCNFCFFRRSNSKSERYRKNSTEIVAAAGRLAESGVHLIDLTMGEDPALLDNTATEFNPLVELITAVKKNIGLPVMISPGVLPDNVLSQLARAGANWYACYQETHQRKLFNRLRPGQDYDRRLNTKRTAHRLGLLIEEGLLCGVGESSADIARSMQVMQELDADQVRVMNFIPQPGTPMAGHTPSDPFRETLISAVLRIVFPDRLIPASLDVDGLAGLGWRLDAGANVVTSIVPPGTGLVGVAQHCLDIEDGRRTSGAVVDILTGRGLEPADPAAYVAWIENRRRKLTGRVQPAAARPGSIETR